MLICNCKIHFTTYILCFSIGLNGVTGNERIPTYGDTSGMLRASFVQAKCTLRYVIISIKNVDIVTGTFEYVFIGKVPIYRVACVTAA